MGRRWRWSCSVIAGAALVAGTLLAAPAYAGFPGKNGAIAFASYADANRIYTMDAWGHDVTEILETGSDPQWAPDGKRIVFTDHTVGVTTTSLFTVQGDGSGVRQLTPDLLNAYEPAWSPDGKWVVFTVAASDFEEDLYVIRRDGRGLRQLTSLPGREYMPAWSPDGRHIAFCRDSQLFGNADVYLVEPDGSALESVTGSILDSEYAPSWSPTGDRLVFERYGFGKETADLFTSRSDGGDEQRVTSTSWDENWPSYSPDGQHLLFGSNKDGDWDIYSLRLNDARAVKLTHNDTDERVADWQSR